MPGRIEIPLQDQKRKFRRNKKSENVMGLTCSECMRRCEGEMARMAMLINNNSDMQISLPIAE